MYAAGAGGDGGAAGAAMAGWQACAAGAATAGGAGGAAGQATAAACAGAACGVQHGEPAGCDLWSHGVGCATARRAVIPPHATSAKEEIRSFMVPRPFES